ncbi:MAG: HAD family hydrolase [Glaciecola sp.]|nr:HAD family hydrolase [Glaciecola sp.]MDG1816073.1 HAD family hydrolase [Glaciecola sp.]MDG2098299.1 HAD family hydrolase [Glaciecola sp.]
MSKSRVKGIIFDLDGTLVTSSIDFSALKQKIGCPSDQDILAYIAEIEETKKQEAALSLVMRMEFEDALTSECIPGVQAFLDKLKANNIPMAIVTRNCRVATSVKINNHNIPIKLVLTREDAPCKPNPDALNIIAEYWGFESEEVAYVGDYIYDIEAANRANMKAWAYQYQVPEGIGLQVDLSFTCFTELDISELIHSP